MRSSDQKEPVPKWQMSAENAEEYTRSLGQIMSGGWRQIALAQKLGVPQALDLTTDAWVRERIGGYVRLGLDERQEAAKELTDPNGDFHLTQRQAAEVLGVGKGTIQRDLQDGPSGPVDVAALRGDADDDGPDDAPEDGVAYCADCGEPHDDDEPCPEIEDYGRRSAPGQAEQPTIGEILGDDLGTFDDTGLAEEMAATRRQQRAAGLLIEMLYFAENLPPEVMTEGIRPDHLPTIAAELGVVLRWIERAYIFAHDPRTQIRRVP
jgi:hypothetical protein